MPVKSPERQGLATAIERHRAALDRLDRAQRGRERVRELRREALAAVEQAEAKLREIEQPAALLARLLDQATAPADNPGDELADAQRSAADAERAAALLDEEIRSAETAVEMARSVRDSAAAAVVKSEAGAALLAAFDDVLDRLAAAAAVLTAVGPLRLPDDHRSQNWLSRIVELPNAPPPAAAKAEAARWRAAITALADDANAPLPAVAAKAA